MVASKLYLEKFIFLSVLIFSLLSCNEAENSPYPAISFSKQPTFQNSERATASSFVINDRAYVLLGRNNNNPVRGLRDCWEFNPSTNLWTRKADFPSVGRVGAIAEVVNCYAYVGFGFNPDKGVFSNDSTIFSDFWRYDPVLNYWTRLADFPVAEYGGIAPLTSCASFTYQKWIYILGLSAKTTAYGHVWRYNTEDNSWERMKDFAASGRGGAVSCSDGEKFFFGLGYRTNCLSDWWRYYPETDSWKKCKSLPGKGRVNAVAFSVGNRYFVATGRNVGGTLTDDKTFGNVMEYDADKDVWYERGTLPAEPRENSVAMVISDKVYLGMGEYNEVQLGDFWVFHP